MLASCSGKAVTTMRDAEEVARDALGCTEVHPDCPEWFHPTGFHTPPNPCVKCDELHAVGVIRARDAEVRAEAYRDLWAHCYDDGDAAAIVGGFALVTRELGNRAGHGGPDLDRYCDEMARRDHEDAATLAGLREETDIRHRQVRVPCDCEHPMHRRLVGDETPDTHADIVPVRVRRYTTPWEPDPRTDEERSGAAIAQLRRRLLGRET